MAIEKKLNKIVNLPSNALIRFITNYFDSWEKYGVLFASFITVVFFLNGKEYNKLIQINDIIYYGIISIFFLFSIIICASQIEKLILRYNPADRVAWEIGTKPKPPKYIFLAKTIWGIWFFSFLAVVYFDLLIFTKSLVEPARNILLFTINIVLLLQFIMAVIKSK